MKNKKTKSNLKTRLAALVLAITVSAPLLHAQITVPNADGSDLALNITTNTWIDLSQATNGVWTSPSQKPGSGTYDSSQWAVIFKYSSVNISAGAMLSFSNHPTHAPVVWLVNGSVTINGNLNLDGQPGSYDPVNLPEPGPGGFRGGGGPILPGIGGGPGFGPGGNSLSGIYAYNQSYNGLVRAYGNPTNCPLIGGSGGGYSTYPFVNGSAGGGAILIAATGTISFNGGYCHADGGSGIGYPGSGGAIRLVANQISGNGKIEAMGGDPNAGTGRIRLEANSIIGNLTNNPLTVGVAPANNTALVFPPNAPTVTITSIGGQNTPADPQAKMSVSTGADDLTLVTTNTVTIQLQTMNFPTNGTVTVFINPRNAGQTVRYATLVSGNATQATWQVPNVALLYPAHTVIQAHATY